MSPFWIIIFTLLVVTTATAINYIAIRFTEDSDTTQWVLEHIHCPIVRILSLLVIVGLMYSNVNPGQESAIFWQLAFSGKNINNLINIVFFGSLLMAFIPFIEHPIFSLPVQSCVTLALVFNWQYGAQEHISISLLPDILLILKIIAYMALAYFATRHISISLSSWIDEQLTIKGSIKLIGDAIYLVLQIPVIMMYGAYISSQLPELS